MIFTLENGHGGEVVGRQVVDVRICSCPKRDRTQEETKYQQDRAKVLGCADGLARSNSVFTKPSAKKRRMEVEEFVMVPVRNLPKTMPSEFFMTCDENIPRSWKWHATWIFQVAKLDFEKINEFAESAVIMRNLEKANQIRDQRKKLLEMWVKSKFYYYQDDYLRIYILPFAGITRGI